MALITTNSPPLQKMVHPKSRALRKFCFCINLRAGVVISCMVWAVSFFFFYKYNAISITNNIKCPLPLSLSLLVASYN